MEKKKPKVKGLPRKLGASSIQSFAEEPTYKLIPVEGKPAFEMTPSEEEEALDFLRSAIAYRKKNPLPDK